MEGQLPLVERRQHGGPAKAHCAGPRRTVWYELPASAFTAFNSFRHQARSAVRMPELRTRPRHEKRIKDNPVHDSGEQPCRCLYREKRTTAEVQRVQGKETSHADSIGSGAAGSPERG